MSLTWLAVAPLFLAAAALMVLWTAKRLLFFSREARDLGQINISTEVRELRIHELELLASNQADRHRTPSKALTRRQRHQEITQKLQETRQWLHLIIANAALFQEVARFRIQAADCGRVALTVNEDDLPFKVMDRASMVHLIAAACLVKLHLIDFFRTVLPIYMPELANQFRVRGCDLIAWYRDLAKEMLTLAKEYSDDLTYDRFAAQLSGSLQPLKAPRFPSPLFLP